MYQDTYAVDFFKSRDYVLHEQERTLRWFEQHRQEWIAETLHVFGFINREHIERKFGVSTPQASIDLQKFQRANPSRIAYDASAKRYVSTEKD